MTSKHLFTGTSILRNKEQNNYKIRAVYHDLLNNRYEFNHIGTASSLHEAKLIADKFIAANAITTYHTRQVRHLSGGKYLSKD